MVDDTICSDYQLSHWHRSVTQCIHYCRKKKSCLFYCNGEVYPLGEIWVDRNDTFVACEIFYNIKLMLWDLTFKWQCRVISRNLNLDNATACSSVIQEGGLLMAEIFKKSFIYQETLCCVLSLAFYSFPLRIGSSSIDKYVVLFCIYATLFITPYLGHQSSDSRQKVHRTFLSDDKTATESYRNRRKSYGQNRIKIVERQWRHSPPPVHLRVVHNGF